MTVRRRRAPWARTEVISGVPGLVILAGLTYANPKLAVTMNPYGTLDAATHLAVASATVSCDHRTPVTVFGTIGQPLSDPAHAGMQGTFLIPEGVNGGGPTQYCTPNLPLLVFIPTRFFIYQHADFTLGPATAELQAQPFGSFFAGRPATVTADRTVQLIDFAGTEGR